MAPSLFKKKRDGRRELNSELDKTKTATKLVRERKKKENSITLSESRCVCQLKSMKRRREQLPGMTDRKTSVITADQKIENVGVSENGKGESGLHGVLGRSDAESESRCRTACG